MPLHRVLLSFFLGLVLLAGCRSARDTGIISYDPPGATTLTKPILEQHPRVIGFSDTKVWVSNEHAGARLNDFYKVNDTLYRAEVHPENAPINHSAWYGFKIWSEYSQIVNILITYRDGSHRYYPKISLDGFSWSPMDSTAYLPDSSNGSAVIRLKIGPEPIWVSAQEIITFSDKMNWSDSLIVYYSYIDRQVIGTSHRGRPVDRLIINDTGSEMPPALLVFARQHPPEVTGSLAMKAFIAYIMGNDPLARQFRSQFQVIIYPLINPDGVDLGHWRHNAGGVDLNRDWKDFNQPETRAVRDDLLSMQEQGLKVYYGFDFHSTSYDVFYTIRKDITTWPEPGLTDRWLEGISFRLPDYSIREEAFGVASPISKNWVFHTFGCAAVTYEVGDNTSRDLLRDVAWAAADSMMEELLMLLNPN